MEKYISFGGINLKSLKYILLMSVSNVLNMYIYGFTYIECFYPMNIYRIIYEAIFGENKNKDFTNHRVFDPLFSYLGIIIIAYFLPKDKSESNADDEEPVKHDLKTHENNISIKLIKKKKKNI